MKQRGEPLRLLTAVPLCDGHDSAINTINMELVRHGVEVVYLGYHRSARDIVRAAIQEDVRAIGISSYNGGHVEFFGEVMRLLRKAGAGDIGVFGGGGGTITAGDVARMRRSGVGEIFMPGMGLEEIVERVVGAYGGRRVRARRAVGNGVGTDRALARGMTGAMRGRGRLVARRGGMVVGITGPGGAGKTTLIDELVLRFLRKRAEGRVAILAHDPSRAGAGALLGDRATMIYSQSDRVFMRSVATRGAAGGLAAGTGRALGMLRGASGDGRGFDWVLIETAGVGQEAMPFGWRRGERGGIDKTVYVTSPEYGSVLQLQKIAMLDRADIVVVNKADLAGAKTACAELELRLAANRRGQAVAPTIARQHGDAGVDRLLAMLLGEGGRER